MVCGAGTGAVSHCSAVFTALGVHCSGCSLLWVFTALAFCAQDKGDFVDWELSECHQYSNAAQEGRSGDEV